MKKNYSMWLAKSISLYASQYDSLFSSHLALTACYQLKIQYMPLTFSFRAATLPVVSHLVFLLLIILPH